MQELRDQWHALLGEAAQCCDPARQRALEAQLQALSPRVGAAGISLKYSKKVPLWLFCLCSVSTVPARPHPVLAHVGRCVLQLPNRLFRNCDLPHVPVPFAP